MATPHLNVTMDHGSIPCSHGDARDFGISSLDLLPLKLIHLTDVRNGDSRYHTDDGDHEEHFDETEAGFGGFLDVLFYVFHLDLDISLVLLVCAHQSVVTNAHSRFNISNTECA